MMRLVVWTLVPVALPGTVAIAMGHPWWGVIMHGVCLFANLMGYQEGLGGR